jgi:RimJ/RimL family protein N-acetyltransferase
VTANTEYRSERLILRPWQAADKPLFAAMNADPRVMEFFPALQTRQRSDEMADLFNEQLASRGYTFWAAERRDCGDFIGFVGLSCFTADLPFCPCVEIGWRLAFDQWGHGFATEAATKSLQLAFGQFNLDEVFSITTLKNVRSRHVMEKIGMSNTNNNFLHPAVPRESGMQEHCLYRITSRESKPQTA